MILAIETCNQARHRSKSVTVWWYNLDAIGNGQNCIHPLWYLGPRLQRETRTQTHYFLAWNQTTCLHPKFGKAIKGIGPIQGRIEKYPTCQPSNIKTKGHQKPSNQIHWRWIFAFWPWFFCGWIPCNHALNMMECSSPLHGTIKNTSFFNFHKSSINLSLPQVPAEKPIF